MTRVKDINGTVHFAGSGHRALCSASDRNLLGESVGMKETDAIVDRPECTLLYCEVRNTPLNAVADASYDRYWESLADAKFGRDSQ